MTDSSTVKGILVVVLVLGLARCNPFAAERAARQRAEKETIIAEEQRRIAVKERMDAETARMAAEKTAKGLAAMRYAVLTAEEMAIGEIRSEGGRITGVDLSSTRITDAGLRCLKGLPQLQTLNLESTEITDAGLAHLGDLIQLRELDLSSTKVTDAGVAELKKALPKVTIKR